LMSSRTIVTPSCQSWIRSPFESAQSPGSVPLFGARRILWVRMLTGL
jgi:hypothetical protein